MLLDHTVAYAEEAKACDRCHNQRECAWAWPAWAQM